MEFNIADLFEAAVDEYPENPCLIVGYPDKALDQVRTLAEMEDRANRFAHALQERGLGRGDHIAIYAQNCAEWVECMWGIYKIRAIAINVNWRYVEGELRYLLDNSDAKAVVYQQRFADRLRSIRPALPTLAHAVIIADRSGGTATGLDAGEVDYEQLLASASPVRDFEPRSGSDHYVLYTGGTTGLPKGVVWRQEDFIKATAGWNAATGRAAEKPEDILGDSDGADMRITMSMAPLMHANGQWTAFRGGFTGCKAVIMSRFDPALAWRLVEEHRVTTLSVLGDAMARPLIEELVRWPGRYDTSSLAAVNSSAAVLSPAVRSQILRALPGVELSEVTGSSESTVEGRAVHSADHDAGGPVRILPRPGTIVVDENLQPLSPGTGQVGKIARSGAIPLRYYKDAEKSATTFVTINGQRHVMPGDFALLEADGSITLLGRGAVSINTGGEKVYPEEVEGAVKSHPAIYDAVVVGVPDERWGQRVTALVELRPSRDAPSLTELQDHCRTLIAGYKLPRTLLVLDQMQRHISGKPDYKWAAQYARDRAKT
jgi:acyl-CoA synthetase (AMP-forming)/AMP-acid ligase II